MKKYVSITIAYVIVTIISVFALSILFPQVNDWYADNYLSHEATCERWENLLDHYRETPYNGAKFDRLSNKFHEKCRSYDYEQEHGVLLNGYAFKPDPLAN